MNVNLSSVKVERNDTDKAIEQRFHMSVPQIFRELGEETFREAEKETVLDICQGSRAKVIALGGGAIVMTTFVGLVNNVESCFIFTCLGKRGAGACRNCGRAGRCCKTSRCATLKRCIDGGRPST